MRIRRLKLSNFRSVAEGEVVFPGHTVIIGGNSVGKSTICEALDLLLGPDRLSRSTPIDEHDFFQRRYLDADGAPILIELEVVLTDLADDVLTKFRMHLEYWNTATDSLLDETSAPEDVDNDDVVPALRIKFEGAYDIEEDEFRAETYFASPPVDEEERRARVTRPAKRQFGFIYLRALRTGARALSLERGCLGAQLAISVNNCPPPRDPRSRMTSFKRTQRKYVQKAYRVRNWREYETGLRARGSLTVWLGLTDGKLANWNSPRPTRRKPGRQRKYSNHAIETTVTLGLVFGLASRQTEGFLRSRLTLLNLDNDVPDHSTISRRKARLGQVASYERRTVKPVHLRIDSSGLSVHVGQLRTPPKARDYRKLHLAVDEPTSDVVACELTSKRARDASRVASLVGQIERPIASAKADAAYDTGDVYKTLENHRAHRSPKVLIPPRKGAQLALDSAGTRQRNRNIRARSRVGKRKWYVASGYSRRSKVETTFHRYKAILGSAMRARGLASQRVEVRLGCKILNTMTALGIPDGEMIG